MLSHEDSPDSTDSTEEEKMVSKANSDISLNEASKSELNLLNDEFCFLQTFSLNNEELELLSIEGDFIKEEFTVKRGNLSAVCTPSSCSNKRQFDGKISRILKKTKEAYIKPDNNSESLAKEIKCQLFDIINLSGIDVDIWPGFPVTYSLSGKRDFGRIPIAEKVFVKAEEPDVGNQLLYSKMKQWHKGVILPFNKNNSPYCFIKPRSSCIPRDVFLSRDLFPSDILPVDSGDEIEFILHTINREKPKAFKCRLLRYSRRTLVSLINYFDESLTLLEDTNRNTIILSSTKLWSFLCSISFGSDNANNYYALRLTHFTLKLIKSCEAMNSSFASVTHSILSSSHYNENSSLFHFINSQNLKRSLNIQPQIVHSSLESDSIIYTVISEFLETALKLDSTLTNRAIPFLRHISDCLTSQSIQGCLINVIQSISSQNSHNSSQTWRILPLVPDDSEMKSSFLEDNSSLLPVKVGEKYLSAEDYLDTYYRLLRTECFSAIQKGIDSLCTDQLDERDMNVYHTVSLCGYELTNSGLCLALRFTPSKEILAWDRVNNFMFGNLLCLSPSGKFVDDHIWATVANRDVELLNKFNTILVQLCSDQNKLSVCEIILVILMFNRQTIMVESPTHFPSFKPVLESLQKFKMEDFPLYQEIVECQSTSKFPDYLSEDSELLPTCVLPQIGSRLKLGHFLDSLKEGEGSILDESQSKVIEYALTNRLAVIQGPPGCGKTFIGVKLTELILSLHPKINTPILVLTYKNHALDEFLKLILTILGKDDIVRIGGQSKEEILNACNLKHLMREEIERSRQQKYSKKKRKMYRDDAYSDNMRHIHSTREKSQQVLDQLQSATRIYPELLLEKLKEEQLRSFLENAPLDRSICIHGARKSFRPDKKWLLSVMTYVMKKYQSLTHLFSLKFTALKEDSDEYFFTQLAVKIMEFWWPQRKDLKSLKKFHTAFSVKRFESKSSRCQVAHSGDQDNSDFDIELFETILENRLMAEEFGLGHARNQSNPTIWPKLNNKFLIRLRDFPPSFEKDNSILTINDIWSLGEIQKIQFLGSVMKKDFEYSSARLESVLAELKYYETIKQNLETSSKISLLRNKKLIGMTIVGASIDHSLIQNLQPEVVIVEEAAEILEPNLIAALSPGIKHLILIGDQKQLRPNVDCYKLCKEFRFNVSMMERLVSMCDYRFESLNSQSRMRPELSKLLKDIYPDLKNNDKIISSYEPPKCMDQSIFFWTHDCPEIAERSYRNMEEVARIKYLTLFLINSDVEASEITVLGAYKGQTTQLRKEIRQYEICRNVIISTIDMYQGDENKYVIVSLVRSNDKGNIGFLAEPNRRCVAQSRAKCGLYFVGNGETFKRNPHWKYLIDQLKESDSIGPALSIRCIRHCNHTHHIRDVESFRGVLADPSKLCKTPCGFEMPCKLKEHACRKSCIPSHSHQECMEKVKFTYKMCGHESTKLCYQDELEVPCNLPCPIIMDCGTHSCKESCGPPHDHVECQELINYKFPFCGHESIRKKKCYEPIRWRCREFVLVSGSCGHTIKKRCYENLPMCRYPCSKTRQCGHPCQNFCGEDCENQLCPLCEANLETEINENIKRRIEEINAEMKDKEKTAFILKKLSNSEGDCAEYQKVEDLVMKFIKPEHSWYPTVTQIEKIINLKLRKKFEKAKLKVNNQFSDYKFHGTGEDEIRCISRDGFKISDKEGMFGKGIYFATDSSKSAQEIYTKGSNKLLLCEVLLGCSLIVEKADKKLTLKKVKAKGCDSVFARRGTKSTGGVMNDEYIIYNNRQAYPKYIITFQTSSLPDLPLWTSLPEVAQFKRTTVQHPREFKPDDPYQNMYRFAEGLFYHMMASKGRSSNQNRIKEIDIIQNKLLEEKFKEKKSQFSTSGISNKVILAFHGTDAQNIDSILENNFQLDRVKRQLHGRGHYFSEFPDISLGYGQGLLLCELLPGSEYRGADDYPSDYHSKLFDPDASLQNSSTMIIIRDSDQILPRFVIHLM